MMALSSVQTIRFGFRRLLQSPLTSSRSGYGGAGCRYLDCIADSYAFWPPSSPYKKACFNATFHHPDPRLKVFKSSDNSRVKCAHTPRDMANVRFYQRTKVSAEQCTPSLFRRLSPACPATGSNDAPSNGNREDLVEERRDKRAQVLEDPSVLAAKEQSSQPTSEVTDDSTAQRVDARAKGPKSEDSLLEEIKIAENIAAVTQLDGDESSRSMAEVSLKF
jgi:hypothetical protein